MSETVRRISVFVMLTNQDRTKILAGISISPGNIRSVFWCAWNENIPHFCVVWEGNRDHDLS